MAFRLRSKNIAVNFIAHLEQLDRLYGPKPGYTVKPVVLVEDNGPIHVSKLTRAALAARSHWLTVEWLPKYAPELNDIEVVWHDLKAHHLAHQTFTGAEALDREIHAAVETLWISSFGQIENFDSAARQRYHVPTLHFHSLSWNGPKFGSKIELTPYRATYLTAAVSVDHQELKCEAAG